MTEPLTKQEKQAYDERFMLFKRKLSMVSRLRPREKYLYPLMRGVPFKDMETSLEMVIISFGEKVERIQKKRKTGSR